MNTRGGGLTYQHIKVIGVLGLAALLGFGVWTELDAQSQREDDTQRAHWERAYGIVYHAVRTEPRLEMVHSGRSSSEREIVGTRRYRYVFFYQGSWRAGHETIAFTSNDVRPQLEGQYFVPRPLVRSADAPSDFATLNLGLQRHQQMCGGPPSPLTQLSEAISKASGPQLEQAVARWARCNDHLRVVVRVNPRAPNQHTLQRDPVDSAEGYRARAALRTWQPPLPDVERPAE